VKIWDDMSVLRCNMESTIATVDTLKAGSKQDSVGVGADEVLILK
jgi:hypothetical protein